MTARRARIADFVAEFPRINDRLIALPTRFVYMPTLTESLEIANPPAATFNTITRVDTESGIVSGHDFRNRIEGEAVFIPRPGSAGEVEGYLSTFAHDPVA
jgi:carotenoid cleavage dioxygenase-like enzyme